MFKFKTIIAFFIFILLILPITQTFAEEQINKTIAVIDTGISDDLNVIEKTSILDKSDGTDDNGHGTKVIKAIFEQNPNANVISIKALDKYGFGDAGSIVRAINYAMEKEVDIINISFTARNTEENQAVNEALSEAIKKGITVVASAGNNGQNADNYIPANLEGVIVVVACDEHGKLLPTSNYGKTVDIAVNTTSTSLAAAQVSGWLSQNDINELTSEFHSVNWTDPAENPSYILNAENNKFITNDDAWAGTVNTPVSLYNKTIYNDGTGIIPTAIWLSTSQTANTKTKSEIITEDADSYTFTELTPGQKYYIWYGSSSTSISASSQLPRPIKGRGLLKAPYPLCFAKFAARPAGPSVTV